MNQRGESSTASPHHQARSRYPPFLSFTTSAAVVWFGLFFFQSRGGLAGLLSLIVYKFGLKDHRGADLISNALLFCRLWYVEPNATGYAKFYSRSYDAVIRVYETLATCSKRTSARASLKKAS
jgi:hypothetical protein